MTKKDFIALADALRIHNQTADGRTEFTPDHLQVLADFRASQAQLQCSWRSRSPMELLDV